MGIEIRRPTGTDMPNFHRVLGDVFGSTQTSDAISRFEQYCEPERLRAAFDGDQLVATHGTYSLQVTVPGDRIAAGGTTVVTVLPTHRRRGIFRRLMTEHLREVREQGESIAVLWTSEFPIYGCFGFGLASDQVSFELDRRDAELRDMPPSRGAMQFVDKQTALAMFPAIHDVACKRRPGMFRRWPNWWEFRVLADPETERGGGTEQKRVIYTRDGVPCGYVLYRMHRRSPMVFRDRWLVIDIVELTAVDDEAELALWRYLFGIDLVGVIQSERQPVDSKLLWWLRNQRAFERKIQEGLWLRVVDVQAALEARTYAQPGQVDFAIDDDTCPWNTGSYRLCVDDAGAGRIAQLASPTDIRMSPQALGAIYLGGQNVRDLAIAGLATGPPHALAQFDAIFRWYPAPWCQERF